MILHMITHAQGGHLGASLSEADILTALFFHTLRLSPENVNDPDRDRFVLSKSIYKSKTIVNKIFLLFFFEICVDMN
jgi:transketolase N-terminal domain/subunit